MSQLLNLWSRVRETVLTEIEIARTKRRIAQAERMLVSTTKACEAAQKEIGVLDEELEAMKTTKSTLESLVRDSKVSSVNQENTP